MKQHIRSDAEVALGHMAAALREAETRVERVASALGDCEMEHYLAALREVATLQTALGDVSIQLDVLRSLCARAVNAD